MYIEVVHVDDCPNWREAGERLRDALAATGLDGTAIKYCLLATAGDTARVRFAGSPTILVDGEDLFPGAGQTTELACRVYTTPTGLAGLPTTEQLIDAIAHRGR